MRILAAVLCLWAGGVSAQFIADDVDVDSALGPVEIVDSSDGFSRELHVGDWRFFEDGLYRFVSVRAQRGALYLIGLSTGGTGCAATYVWLHTDGGAPRLSDEFGTCAGADAIRADAETVTVTMRSFDAADGFIDFVYDGSVIREQIVGQRSAGVGTNPKDWVGRYPFEIFSDADWRAPLVEVMGEDAYRRAGNTIEAATPMEIDAPWVVGWGCRSRRCDVAYGAIAIHPDGTIIVALRTPEAGLEVFGSIGGLPPQVITDVLEGR